MKILIAAPLFPGNLWWYLQDVFLQLNTEVELFDYRELVFGRDYHLNLSYPVIKRWLNKVRWNWLSRSMNQRLINQVLEQKPDITLVIKGELIFPETIQYLRQQSPTKLVLWYPDSSTFLGPPSIVPNITNSLPFYELVLFCDPQHVPPELLEGIHRHEMLTFGCYPPVHRSMPLTKAEEKLYKSEICFVGNSHNVGSLRYKTIKALLVHGLNVRCWGSDWLKTSLYRQYSGNFEKAVYGETMVKVYNASKIVLNINGDYPYLNVRNFEAPACGVCTITSALEGFEQYFAPQREVVTYNSISELIEKIEFYLNHDQEREIIGRAGQKRAHEEHSLQKRMVELLEMVTSKGDL